MGKLELTDDQKERAVNLFHRLSEDDIHTPSEILDSWTTPPRDIDQSERQDRFERVSGFVEPCEIEGAFESTINRLEPGRLQKVLKWMVEGEYEIERPCPPVLQRREDNYYVLSDGHHRSIAAKAIGIDELYVEYESVPLQLLE